MAYHYFTVDIQSPSPSFFPPPSSGGSSRKYLPHPLPPPPLPLTSSTPPRSFALSTLRNILIISCSSLVVVLVLLSSSFLSSALKPVVRLLFCRLPALLKLVIGECMNREEEEERKDAGKFSSSSAFCSFRPFLRKKGSGEKPIVSSFHLFSSHLFFFLLLSGMMMMIHPFQPFH